MLAFAGEVSVSVPPALDLVPVQVLSPPVLEAVQTVLLSGTTGPV